ncbi:hypothetical protein KQX64_10885 [Rhodopseudomonas palustris]|nr:hypothetical protein KQX64_10885 [Rhodopseudomonas palustris]
MASRTRLTQPTDTPINGRDPSFSEDDISRQELGSTTDGSQQDRDRMAPQRAKKTPRNDDPGHTA